MRNVRSIAWLLSAAVLLTGCGFAVSGGSGSSLMTAESVPDGSASEEYAAWDDGDAVCMNLAEETGTEDDADSAVLPEDTGASDADAAAEERKLVTTMQISMETKDFDSSYAGVKAKVKELGGWIAGDYLSTTYRWNASSDRGGEVRYASLSLRVPAEKLDDFLEYAASATNVTSKSATTEDVTLRYTDLAARIAVKETEVSRLQSFMEEAETVEDMLAIEEKLSEAQYELDTAKSQQKILSGQITYSEVSVNLQEVLTYTETEAKSDLQRIREGFLQNLEDVFFEVKELFIAFVTHLPALAVIAAVLFAGIRCIRRFRRTGKGTQKGRQKARKDVPQDNSGQPDERSQKPAGENRNEQK